MKIVAIVLAAGTGSRMKSNIPKQFMELKGYPILYYSLKVFEESFVDEIILVTRENDIEYCKKEIVNKYKMRKVKKIIAGGSERYLSVYQGLQQIQNADYVYIHDGARPFLNQEIIERVQNELEKAGACVVGMPVKDTIKIVDSNRKVTDTPERKYVWQIQTPQAFCYDLVKEAYDKVLQSEISNVTDDAMVVELMEGHLIKVVEGSYTNIKITTPEDLKIGEAIMENEKIIIENLDKS